LDLFNRVISKDLGLDAYPASHGTNKERHMQGSHDDASWCEEKLLYVVDHGGPYFKSIDCGCEQSTK